MSGVNGSVEASIEARGGKHRHLASRVNSRRRIWADRHVNGGGAREGATVGVRVRGLVPERSAGDIVA